MGATCSGCIDDFYNIDGRGLGGKCWHRETAKEVTRYRIHRDSMPAWKGAFTEVRVFDCRREQGFSLYKTLPDFVKREDVRKASR